MKAIVKTKEGAGNITYKEVGIPQVGQDEVLIKVSAAGICGTDLKIHQGTYDCNPPVILGHEYSGTIEAVGAKVSHFFPGDRVVSETARKVCGRCQYCMSGNYLMCPERQSIGYGVNGAMAEYIVVREEIVHRIPDSLSMEEAALCEPAAVAFHAVFDYAEIKPFHNVVVIGPGTIGQLVAQIVKSAGAKVILAGTSKDKYRLEIAKKLGIETVVSDEVDFDQYIAKETGGSLADYSFDCSGAEGGIRQGIDCLKPKGILVQAGLPKENLTIPYGKIPMKELQIKGAFGHINSSWCGVLKMLENKKISVLPLITHRYPMSDWEIAFNQAMTLESVKVLLHP